ncbi:uncharacterized protein [Nicotiana tomentosiformis]|uniref:uncharacterized protein n=1 Tax=Nicotiana tomentosiformis TaxID=4098 RepID=UPI00388C4F8E
MEADALANLGSSTEVQGSESRTVVQLMNSVLDTMRFGIPKEIACDNRPQFISVKVTKFLEDLKIKRITSSLYHPSANGQVESTNKVIIQNLKKRLEATKGNWPEELLGVLWAYRRTTKSSTGDTLFPCVRHISFDTGGSRGTNLKLEERRDWTHVRMAAQKQRMEQYYNRRANLRYFKVGDLVLRKRQKVYYEDNSNKISDAKASLVGD